VGTSHQCVGILIHHHAKIPNGNVLGWVEGSSNYAWSGKALKKYYPDDDIACDVSFRKIVPA
jgi:hypothetical protein